MDKTLSLSAAAWNEICRHAEDEFPDECCGVVFFNGKLDRVQRLENLQNKLHALDPQEYPRTAAIAYHMNPLKLLDSIEEAQRSGGQLKAFYHSHPDHESYFSAEDKAFVESGDPAYLATVQIVVSIYARVVKVIRAFTWSDDQQDFVEIPITKFS